ncbi:MAG: peptide deformylase [Chloroflexi bacterium]|nr:peptide deformylase [Chloroflexota bacterium]
MAVHPIRFIPEPVLRQKAKRVPKIDASTHKLIEDMFESMHAAHGVGLAAPQIGVSLRVIVIGLPDEEPFALINPKIIDRHGTRRIEEGCLSLPGYLGMVDRAEVVKAQAMSVDGEKRDIEATELLAQVLEHEIDHLNGILFIDHIQAHDELWKPDEEAGPHDHDEIDFEHEAAHDRTVPAEERTVETPPEEAGEPEDAGEEEPGEDDDEPEVERVYGHFSPGQLERLADLIEETRTRLISGG